MRPADAVTIPARRGCVGRGLTSPEGPAAAEADGATSGGDGVGATAWYARTALPRSFAFRTGLAFWVLFMACFGVAGVFFYETLQQRVLERVDASITDRLAGIEAVYRTEGIDAVVRIARQRDALPMQTSMGFHLSEGQERIAGNVPVCPVEDGWAILTGTELGLEGDEGHYRFLTTTIGDYDLSLGQSLYALEELRAVALNCLLWALAGSTLVAIAAAAWLARRTQRRLGALRGAIGRVASGDLDARIPLSGHCDDIDAMSGAINAALERLSRSVEGMRQVSTDIAHDLKTPLNRLWIQIDEAATRSRAGHCVGDALELALEDARGIDATFEALLRIAQIEAGARRARFAPFTLDTVLENVAEIYEPVIEEQRQTLTLDCAPDAPLALHGDRELVTQLVVNLLENASHHGGEGVNIRLGCGTASGRPFLVVADDGPGIPAAERDRVLQRLYRLERSRTTRGTGLGLSLVKAIVELHGGELALEDDRPGLKVTVRFAAPDATP